MAGTGPVFGGPPAQEPPPPPTGTRPPVPPVQPPSGGGAGGTTPPAGGGLNIRGVLSELGVQSSDQQKHALTYWKYLCLTLGVTCPDYLRKSARNRRGIRAIGV